MKLEGKIYRTALSTALASFYKGDRLVAKLKEAPGKGFKIGFELHFLDSSPSNDVGLIKIILGFARTRFQIESNANGFPWYYQRKKWYEIFNSKGMLYTHVGNLKIFKANERFQLYLDQECVGTLIFDQGKYSLSFHSKLDLKLCLVASSIFVIERETLQHETV